jgi:hypothetical protein
LPGPLPAAVIAWFDALPGEAGDESRTDQYCRLPEPAALGIKVRAGAKVEIKLRTQELGMRGFRERARGRVEHWEKWSFPLDPAQSDAEDLSQPAGAWISVEKTRRSRPFHVTADGACAPGEGSVSDGGFPSRRRHSWSD